MTEEQLQAKIFQHMWNYYPSTRRRFFHVANELPNDTEYILGEVGRKLGSRKDNKWVYPMWFNTLRAMIRKRIEIFLSKRKASGIVAGIPDMILIHQGRAFAFELKTETGVVSPDQDKVHQIWREDGTPVWIIRSVEEFIKVITELIGQPEIKIAS